MRRQGNPADRRAPRILGRRLRVSAVRWAVERSLGAAVAVAAIIGGAACDKGKHDEARPAPRAPAPVVADAQLAARPDAVAFTGDVAAICATTQQLIQRAIRCAPRSADMLRETSRSLEQDVPTDEPLAARERWASLCAGIAKVYDDQLAGSDPACRLTVDERTRNDAFLEAYYGRRTTPRPTGDATVDKNLADFAAARDVLCACTDEACIRTANKAVTAAARPVPPELTAAMEDAVAISDEVSRCEDRIKQDVARTRQ